MILLDKKNIISRAISFLETESFAIVELIKRLEHLSEEQNQFFNAIKMIVSMNSYGRVIVTGIGKSGHIGAKIASTLASTGTASFFLHPAEASHGDLGMIREDDCILALSNSGESDEIVKIFPLIRRMGIPTIVMTGNLNSTLAKNANVILNTSVEKEACPLGLAPTSSMISMLALGDALAMNLLELRAFNHEDFARTHPGGSLGRKLLTLVKDIMKINSEIPCVLENASLADALFEISTKGMGMTAISDSENLLLGIYTDGDLRRTLQNPINIHELLIKDIMIASPKTITADRLAVDALTLMQNSKINGLIVVDEKNQIVGALNMHDLLKSGII